MKHLHTETVSYKGSSYSRTYTHTHGFAHEAHIHARAWEGARKGEADHILIGQDDVPVVRTTRVVVKVEV